MANKTVPTGASVTEFLNGVEHRGRREDSYILLDMVRRITGAEPQMWGESIVGFGTYRYKYESGREGEFLLTGFSPRKARMTIYIMPGFKQYAEQLAQLGKHKHSVSCLYVGRLRAIDLNILETIIDDSVKRMKEIYPDWWI
ncbi:MAG: DUF1801 domain-containing protein [Stappiaceae bacterium]